MLSTIKNTVTRVWRDSSNADKFIGTLWAVLGVGDFITGSIVWGAVSLAIAAILVALVMRYGAVLGPRSIKVQQKVSTAVETYNMGVADADSALRYAQKLRAMTYTRR